MIIDRLRQGIRESMPSTSNFGESPAPRSLYIPPAHIKALRLESNLVVGTRGVGKSFWTAALNSPELQKMLGDSVQDLSNLTVRVGFSTKEEIAAYPSPEVFAELLISFEPYDIWRAVVFRWLSPLTSIVVPIESWKETVVWVRANPEKASRIFQEGSLYFQTKGEQGLILFDALDRSSNDWQMMDKIVRDLLRVVLWLKSSLYIHAKVFLREDQFARTVTNFPDASKLLATKAELTWQPHDLHGLLWQTLVNAKGEHGQLFRQIYNETIGRDPDKLGDMWRIGDSVKRESPLQRTLFEKLAGPWMGKDKRRGVPYVWSVGHLADGKGRTSPRSFLSAIRVAAEDSFEKYTDYTYALHYESIKRGVQEASQIRIAEMAEDYPWVQDLFQPLSGVTVPCEFSVVVERWEQALPHGLKHINSKRLPPQHEDWTGIRKDLERLGLVETMKDGRINMPDLYRVGFGLGRRGGVRPMAR